METRERRGDENSLAGYIAHLDRDGTPWTRFKTMLVWREMASKPYFYLIKVDECNVHKTIKLGISTNANPHGRLEEYSRFYSGQFKIVLILTFSQWKKGSNSGYMEYMGAKPLQERLELEVKRRLPKAARGTEWYMVSQQRMVLDTIFRIRKDPKFTKHLVYSDPERQSRRQRVLEPD